MTKKVHPTPKETFKLVYLYYSKFNFPQLLNIVSENRNELKHFYYETFYMKIILSFPAQLSKTEDLCPSFILQYCLYYFRYLHLL